MSDVRASWPKFWLQRLTTTGMGEVILLSVVLLAFFAQYYYVALVHDDYGYASLVYGVDPKDAPGFSMGGNDHALADILRFNHYLYFKWSGRVVSTLLVTLFLSQGWPLIVFKACQTLLVVGFFLFLARVTRKNGWFYDSSVFILCCSLYWLIPLHVLNDSALWVTASFSYLWLPVIAVVLIFRFIRQSVVTKTQVALWAPLFTIVGLSHELVGITFCCVLATYLLMQRLFNRRWDGCRSVLLVFAVVGYVVLFFAPGNFVRVNTLPTFYSQSVVDIFISRGHELVKCLFSSKMRLWLSLLVVITIFLARYIRDSQIGFSVINRRLSAITVGMGCGYLVLSYRLIPILKPAIAVQSVVLLLLTTSFLYTALIGTLKQRNGSMLAWGVGFLVYYLVSLAAPSNGDRILLPLYIFLIGFLVQVFAVCAVNVPKISVLVFLVFALNNYIYIVGGYAENYAIHQMNADKLVDSAARIQKGEQIKKIILSKYDTKFSESNPWGKTRYETFWMKHYYKLPLDVELEFVRQKED